MIDLIHVSKTFAGKESSVHAVRDVSLRVESGDIYGVIGFSGAGKSTLLRLINRLEEADGGEIWCDRIPYRADADPRYFTPVDAQGNELAADDPRLKKATCSTGSADEDPQDKVYLKANIIALPEKDLRHVRRSIGMIFQHFNLMPSRTVLENVLFPLKNSGLSKTEATAKAEKLLQLVDIADKINAYPSELSGGQKQRVGIARALANDPQVLLCDEATSALDPQTTQQILALLKRLNQQLGLTIILITHEMAVVKDICNKVTVMEDGYAVEQGSVFDIFSNPREEITKAFIKTTSNLQKMQHLLDENADITKIHPDERIVQFTYIRNTVAEPIVSTVSRRFNIDINILFSNLEIIQGAPLGGLVCILKGPDEKIDEALAWWAEQGIRVEVLKDGRVSE